MSASTTVNRQQGQSPDSTSVKPRKRAGRRRALPDVPTHVPSSPAHSQMVSTLRGQILDGEYVQGDRIPTESELARSFNISVRSVRRGIDELAAQGLLVRRQGSGTYVRNGRSRSMKTGVKNLITVVLPLAIRGYHPFFSEMLRGIREGISAQTYDAHELTFTGRLIRQDDVGPMPWSESETLAALHASDNLAGVICGASVADSLRNGLPDEVAIVAADATDRVPYVVYDLQEELNFAIRRQVADGARNIWVYGGSLEWRMESIQGAVIRYVPGVQKDIGLLSSHIRYAFEEAEKFFSSGAAFDGVVVASDFEAQGVLDAAVKCGLKVPENVRFTCLVNRESQLIHPFPMTLMIADGYRKGRELTKLLNQHVTRSSNRPQRVILRCDETVYDET